MKFEVFAEQHNLLTKLSAIDDDKSNSLLFVPVRLSALEGYEKSNKQFRALFVFGIAIPVCLYRLLKANGNVPTSPRADSLDLPNILLIIFKQKLE